MIKKRLIKITGMTCNNCKVIIEKNFIKLDGVKECRVDLSSAIMNLEYDDSSITQELIQQTLNDLGYGIESRLKKISSFFVYGILLFVIFKLMNNNMNFSSDISSSAGYGLLFLTGIFTSFHCISMCGGICLSQSIHHKSSGLLYNLGRLTSYTILGAIIGGIGSVFSLSLSGKATILVIAGLFMMLMALNTLGVLPIFNRMKSLFPSLKFSSRTKTPFIVGLLNGFMPCGPLQTMQLYALGTGSIIEGGLSMFVFALGTIPLMLGLSFITTILNRRHFNKIFKFSGMLILLLGFVMTTRGLALAGFSVNPFEKSTSITKNEVELVDGKQEILLIANAKGYSPKTLHVVKDIPVKLTVQGDSINYCNETFLIPEYGIEKKLVSGENIIEFTPTQTKDVTYTCWMGMLTGQISIVDDLEQVEEGLEDKYSGLRDFSSEFSSQGCHSNESQVNEVTLAQITDGKQTVKMFSDENGFHPNILVVQNNIPTEWIIEGKGLNPCNDTIVIPDSNYAFPLNEGENIIKFTPTSEGEILFTCGMGMLSGKLIIVEDINAVDTESYINTSLQLPEGLSSGCCGQ